jgi:hypothetical protein
MSQIIDRQIGTKYEWDPNDPEVEIQTVLWESDFKNGT